MKVVSILKNKYVSSIIVKNTPLTYRNVKSKFIRTPLKNIDNIIGVSNLSIQECTDNKMWF